MAAIEKDDELRSFDVPEVARHPSGYTIYKIIQQITPKELTENSYQIVYWKRYSDIRKLYDTLHRYHQAIYRPGKFPNFPEKSGYMERFNSAIVEQRRVATKEFLNFLLQHLYLRTHDAFKNFFQKGEKILPVDVRTDTLKPESVIQQQLSVPPPLIASHAVEEKKDELLFDVDGDETQKQENHPSNKILEDLNDLRFEEKTNIDGDGTEKRPSNNILDDLRFEEKTDIDGDGTQKQENHPSNKILDDLNDLRFEEKTDIDDLLCNSIEQSSSS